MEAAEEMMKLLLFSLIQFIQTLNQFGLLSILMTREAHFRMCKGLSAEFFIIKPDKNFAGLIFHPMRLAAAMVVSLLVFPEYKKAVGK